MIIIIKELFTVRQENKRVIRCITKEKKGVLEMTISLRLSKADSILIKKFAEMNGITVSELIRSSVMERIEDEYDLKIYKKAMQEFKKNPVTYSLEEVEKELQKNIY